MVEIPEFRGRRKIFYLQSSKAYVWESFSWIPSA